MGRRRKKVVRRPTKRLPQVFICPNCGLSAVRVTINRADEQALVKCGRCGLEEEFSVFTVDQPVDIYCRFTDKYYSKELSVI